MHVTSKHMRGFTLVEMMIAVAIVAILTAVSYPSYTEYVKRSNRSEGQALLSDTAAAQERYFSQNNVYITSDADIAKLNARSDSTTGKYSLSLDERDTGVGYLLTATPNFTDTDCGNLTLNDLGARDITGTVKTRDECWR